MNEVVWPAISKPADAALFALAFQFEQSEWWDPQSLLCNQLLQLEKLLVHAMTSVPLYEDRLDEVRGLEPGALTLDRFRRLPVLTRTDVQEAGNTHMSSALPAAHGAKMTVSTSGSTGRPVRVQTTTLCRLFHGALNLRYHSWHARDLRAKVAALRRVHKKPGGEGPQPWAPGYTTGPMVSLDVGATFGEQLAWLVDQRARYLLTYPSNLWGLLAESKTTGSKPESLHQVITYGEVVPEALRPACEDLWGAPLVDSYSAQEIGAIAFQCPTAPHYHVQSENVLVEIVDSAGAPCEPGSLGRVLVTDLHNFATPLIRYEVGDFAEWGHDCGCGRGLPVIHRIQGRTRGLLTLPSGERFCPRFLTEEFAFSLGIRQLQVVQLSLQRVDVRVAVAAPLSSSDERVLERSIGQTLQHPFELRIEYVDHVPRDPSGKFEEFRSEITPDRSGAPCVARPSTET